MRVSASRLAAIIERTVPRIPSPDPGLEQYTTPGDIAARLAATIAVRAGLDHAFLDLGAGTCRLSAPLLLLGAEAVVAVDADARLAPLCMRALEGLGAADRVVYLVARVAAGRGPLRAFPGVVVTNPPFGVQRRGADREILEYAFSLGPWRVYAILKSGNEDFHRRLAGRWGYTLRVLYRESFPIPAEMMHHRSRIRRVLVDVVEFEAVR